MVGMQARLTNCTCFDAPAYKPLPHPFEHMAVYELYFFLHKNENFQIK